MDKENIINSAIYKEDGKILARFFECDGIKTEVTIKTPSKTEEVRAVDFCGNTLEEVSLEFKKEEKSVKVIFEPYKIITLEIK